MNSQSGRASSQATNDSTEASVEPARCQTSLSSANAHTADTAAPPPAPVHPATAVFSLSTGSSYPIGGSRCADPTSRPMARSANDVETMSWRRANDFTASNPALAELMRRAAANEDADAPWLNIPPQLLKEAGMSRTTTESSSPMSSTQEATKAANAGTGSRAADAGPAPSLSPAAVMGEVVPDVHEATTSKEEEALEPTPTAPLPFPHGSTEPVPAAFAGCQEGARYDSVPGEGICGSEGTDVSLPDFIGDSYDAAVMGRVDSGSADERGDEGRGGGRWWQRRRDEGGATAAAAAQPLLLLAVSQPPHRLDASLARRPPQSHSFSLSTAPDTAPPHSHHQRTGMVDGSCHTAMASNSVTQPMVNVLTTSSGSSHVTDSTKRALPHRHHVARTAMRSLNTPLSHTEASLPVLSEIASPLGPHSERDSGIVTGTHMPHTTSESSSFSFSPATDRVRSGERTARAHGGSNAEMFALSPLSTSLSAGVRVGHTTSGGSGGTLDLGSYAHMRHGSTSQLTTTRTSSLDAPLAVFGHSSLSHENDTNSPSGSPPLDTDAGGTSDENSGLDAPLEHRVRSEGNTSHVGGSMESVVGSAAETEENFSFHFDQVGPPSPPPVPVSRGADVRPPRVPQRGHQTRGRASSTHEPTSRPALPLAPSPPVTAVAATNPPTAPCDNASPSQGGASRSPGDRTTLEGPTDDAAAADRRTSVTKIPTFATRRSTSPPMLGNAVARVGPHGRVLSKDPSESDGGAVATEAASSRCEPMRAGSPRSSTLASASLGALVEDMDAPPFVRAGSWMRLVAEACSAGNPALPPSAAATAATALHPLHPPPTGTPSLTHEEGKERGASESEGLMQQSPSTTWNVSLPTTTTTVATGMEGASGLPTVSVSALAESPASRERSPASHSLPIPQVAATKSPSNTSSVSLSPKKQVSSLTRVRPPGSNEDSELEHTTAYGVDLETVFESPDAPPGVTAAVQASRKRSVTRSGGESSAPGEASASEPAVRMLSPMSLSPLQDPVSTTAAPGSGEPTVTHPDSQAFDLPTVLPLSQSAVEAMGAWGVAQDPGDRRPKSKQGADRKKKRRLDSFDGAHSGEGRAGERLPSKGETRRGARPRGDCEEGQPRHHHRRRSGLGRHRSPSRGMKSLAAEGPPVRAAAAADRDDDKNTPRCLSRDAGLGSSRPKSSRAMHLSTSESPSASDRADVSALQTREPEDDALHVVAEPGKLVVPQGIRHFSILWMLLLYVVVIVVVALSTFLIVYVVTRRITYDALEEIHSYLRHETLLMTDRIAFLPATVTQTLARLYVSDPTSPTAKGYALPPDGELSRLICSVIRHTDLFSVLSTISYVSFNGTGRAVLCEHGQPGESLSAIIYGPSGPGRGDASLLFDVNLQTLKPAQPLKVNARFPKSITISDIAAVAGSGSVVAEWLTAVDRSKARVAAAEARAGNHSDGDGLSVQEQVYRTVHYWRTTRRDRPTVVYTYPFFEPGATRPSYISCRIDASRLLDMVKDTQSEHEKQHSRIMLLGADFGLEGVFSEGPRVNTAALGDFRALGPDVKPFILSCSWCQDLSETAPLYEDGVRQQWAFTRYPDWVTDFNVSDPLMSAALQHVNVTAYVTRAFAFFKGFSPASRRKIYGDVTEEESASETMEADAAATQTSAAEESDTSPAFDGRGEYKVFTFNHRTAAVSIYPVRTTSKLTMILVIATTESILDGDDTVTATVEHPAEADRGATRPYRMNVTFTRSTSKLKVWGRRLSPLNNRRLATLALAVSCVAATVCVYCVLVQGLQAPLLEIVVQLEEATSLFHRTDPKEEEEASREGGPGEEEVRLDTDKYIRYFLESSSQMLEVSPSEHRADGNVADPAASRSRTTTQGPAVPHEAHHGAATHADRRRYALLCPPKWRGTAVALKEVHAVQKLCDELKTRMREMREYLPEGVFIDPLQFGANEAIVVVNPDGRFRSTATPTPSDSGVRYRVKPDTSEDSGSPENDRRERSDRNRGPDADGLAIRLMQEAETTEEEGSDSSGMVARTAAAAACFSAEVKEYLRDTNPALLVAASADASARAWIRSINAMFGKGTVVAAPQSPAAFVSATPTAETAEAPLPSAHHDVTDGDRSDDATTVSGTAATQAPGHRSSPWDSDHPGEGAPPPPSHVRPTVVPRTTSTPWDTDGGTSAAREDAHASGEALHHHHRVDSFNAPSTVDSLQQGSPPSHFPALADGVADVSEGDHDASRGKNAANGPSTPFLHRGARLLASAWSPRRTPNDSLGSGAMAGKDDHSNRNSAPLAFSSSSSSSSSDDGDGATLPSRSGPLTAAPSRSHRRHGEGASLAADTVTRSSIIEQVPTDTLHDGTRYAKCFCTCLSVHVDLHLNGGGAQPHLATLMEVVVAAARKYHGAFDIFAPEMLYMTFGSREPTRDHALLATKCGIEIYSQLPPEALHYVTVVVDAGVYYTGVCGVAEQKGFVLWGRPTGELFAEQQMYSGFRFFILDTVVPLVRSDFRVLPVDTINVSEEKGSPQVILFVLFKGSVSSPSWLPFSQLFHNAFTCLLAQRFDICVRIFETILASPHFPYYGFYMLAYAREQLIMESRKRLGRAEVARQVSEIAVTCAQEMSKHANFCLGFGCSFPAYAIADFPQHPLDVKLPLDIPLPHRVSRTMRRPDSFSSGDELADDSSIDTHSDLEADVDEPLPPQASLHGAHPTETTTTTSGTRITLLSQTLPSAASAQVRRTGVTSAQGAQSDSGGSLRRAPTSSGENAPPVDLLRGGTDNVPTATLATSVAEAPFSARDPSPPPERASPCASMDRPSEPQSEDHLSPLPPVGTASVLDAITSTSDATSRSPLTVGAAVARLTTEKRTDTPTARSKMLSRRRSRRRSFAHSRQRREASLFSSSASPSSSSDASPKDNLQATRRRASVEGSADDSAYGDQSTTSTTTTTTTTSSGGFASPTTGLRDSAGALPEEHLFDNLFDDDGVVRAHAALPLAFQDVNNKQWRRSLRPMSENALCTKFSAVSSYGVMAELTLFCITGNHHGECEVRGRHRSRREGRRHFRGGEALSGSGHGSAPSPPSEGFPSNASAVSGRKSRSTEEEGGDGREGRASASPLSGSVGRAGATSEADATTSSHGAGMTTHGDRDMNLDVDAMEAASSFYHENIVQYISCAVITTTAPPSLPDVLSLASPRGDHAAAENGQQVTSEDDRRALMKQQYLQQQQEHVPRTYFCLVQEFVAGGSLRESVERYGRPLPLGAIRRYCVSILRALEYLHRSRGVVHGLLNPENVIVGVEGSCKIKGMSYLFDWARGDEKLYDSFVEGKACYYAPEVNMGEEKTPASDIFSFGLILLEMLSGAAPWTWTGVVQNEVSARSREELNVILRDNKLFVDMMEQGAIEMRRYGRGRNQYNVKLATMIGRLHRRADDAQGLTMAGGSQERGSGATSGTGPATVSTTTTTTPGPITSPTAFTATDTTPTTGSSHGSAVPVPSAGSPSVDAGAEASASISTTPLDASPAPVSQTASRPDTRHGIADTTASSGAAPAFAPLDASPPLPEEAVVRKGASASAVCDPLANEVDEDPVEGPEPADVAAAKVAAAKREALNVMDRLNAAGDRATVAVTYNNGALHPAVDYFYNVGVEADVGMLQVLEDCLSFDPQERKTASELLQKLSDM